MDAAHDAQSPSDGRGQHRQHHDDGRAALYAGQVSLPVLWPAGDPARGWRYQQGGRQGWTTGPDSQQEERASSPDSHTGTSCKFCNFLGNDVQINYLIFRYSIKDGPQLRLCATWPRRPAGYNNSIPIPHIKAVAESPWCAEMECYCCNQMACAAKLSTNITEDSP